MTLKIRRGTNTERMALTGADAPGVGEPIWTTDTKTLYVGDGSTAGGVAVSGSGSVTIEQTKHVGITTVDGTQSVYSVTAFTGLGTGVTSVTGHHLLVSDALILVETVDYNINAARTQITLSDGIATLLDGNDLQLINFVITLV